MCKLKYIANIKGGKAMKLRIRRIETITTDLNGLRFIPDNAGNVSIFELDMEKYCENYCTSFTMKDGETTASIYPEPDMGQQGVQILLTTSFDNESQKEKIIDFLDVLDELKTLHTSGYAESLTIDCAVQRRSNENGCDGVRFIGFGDAYYTYPKKTITVGFTVVRYGKVSGYKVKFNEDTIFYIEDGIFKIVTDGVTTRIKVGDMPTSSVHKLVNAAIVAKEAAKKGMNDYSWYSTNVFTVE